MNEILLPRRRSWGPWIRDSLKLHKTQWLLPENPFSPHSFRNWPGFTQHSLGASSHLAAPSTHIPVTEKVEMVQGAVCFLFTTRLLWVSQECVFVFVILQLNSPQYNLCYLCWVCNSRTFNFLKFPSFGIIGYFLLR